MSRPSRCIVALGAALTFASGCADENPIRPPRSSPSPPAEAPQPTETYSDQSTIQLLRVGDTTPIALTAGDDPVWSPDGARIAFVSARGGSSQIYVMNRDGSDITQLTHDSRSHAQLSWSPDGGRIAWIDDLTLKVMNVDGSQEMLLASERPPMYAEFSWLMMGAWSPDGRRIAFVSNRDGRLHVVRVDAPAPIALTNRSTSQAADDTPPAWSPDGSTIAFGSIPAGCLSYCSAIDLVSAQGGEVTRLVGGEKQRLTSPAWSPDGSSIAYLGTRIGDCPPGMCGDTTDVPVLHVTNTDGTGKRQLTTGRTGAPAWSADGRTVLVSIGGNVVAIPTDGGAPRLLSRTGADGVLSPDRQWIAFTAPR